jgi:multiple sugar transport system substrate-binding protein
MRVRAILLAAVLVLAPLSAWAADLVVWWEKGYNPDEDQTAQEMVVAFERKTGHKVELIFHTLDDLPGKAAAAVGSGHPPDFVYGNDVAEIYFARWAHEGQLADLTDALGPLIVQFEKDALDQSTLLDPTTGRRGLYTLPIGRVTNHVHVWKSLLERAGHLGARIGPVGIGGRMA